ncbi:hypothetical protein [Escherichia coli]|uniref:hypothetical protein n=1 Tax=Escherichia coli TaxID=562 RepID=UPI0022FD3A46|nr:hypothetical protein [Escherichia coli]MDC9689324.1 hypothetical protein [Escherichia coli]WCA26575.1 hypothetical protein PHA55_09630 [Escherichia coli]
MKKIIASIVLALGLVGTANAKPIGNEAAVTAILSTSFNTIKDMCLETSDDPKACYAKYSKRFMEQLDVELDEATK